MTTATPNGKAKHASKAGSKKSNLLFGYSVCAVLRWMGKRGLDFDQAKQVLKARKVTGVPDSTVRAGLGLGRRNDEKYPPAPVKPDEAKELLAGVVKA